VHGLVVAAPAGDEDQRHQPAADGEREDDAEDEGDPAVDADRDRIHGIEEPGRPGQRQQQERDEEGDEQSDFQS
jgi:hypothetical protein